MQALGFQINAPQHAPIQYTLNKDQLNELAQAHLLVEHSDKNHNNSSSSRRQSRRASNGEINSSNRDGNSIWGSRSNQNGRGSDEFDGENEDRSDDYNNDQNLSCFLKISKFLSKPTVSTGSILILLTLAISLLAAIISITLSSQIPITPGKANTCNFLDSSLSPKSTAVLLSLLITPPTIILVSLFAYSMIDVEPLFSITSWFLPAMSFGNAYISFSLAGNNAQNNSLMEPLSPRTGQNNSQAPQSGINPSVMSQRINNQRNNNNISIDAESQPNGSGFIENGPNNVQNGSNNAPNSPSHPPTSPNYGRNALQSPVQRQNQSNNGAGNATDLNDNNGGRNNNHDENDENNDENADGNHFIKKTKASSSNGRFLLTSSLNILSHAILLIGFLFQITVLILIYLDEFKCTNNNFTPFFLQLHAYVSQILYLFVIYNIFALGLLPLSFGHDTPIACTILPSLLASKKNRVYGDLIYTNTNNYANRQRQNNNNNRHNTNHNSLDLYQASSRSRANSAHRYPLSQNNVQNYGTTENTNSNGGISMTELGHNSNQSHISSNQQLDEVDTDPVLSILSPDLKKKYRLLKGFHEEIQDIATNSCLISLPCGEFFVFDQKYPKMPIIPIAMIIDNPPAPTAANPNDVANGDAGAQQPSLQSSPNPTSPPPPTDNHPQSPSTHTPRDAVRGEGGNGITSPLSSIPQLRNTTNNPLLSPSLTSPTAPSTALTNSNTTAPNNQPLTNHTAVSQPNQPNQPNQTNTTQNQSNAQQNGRIPSGAPFKLQQRIATYRWLYLHLATPPITYFPHDSLVKSIDIHRPTSMVWLYRVKRYTPLITLNSFSTIPEVPSYSSPSSRSNRNSNGTLAGGNNNTTGHNTNNLSGTSLNGLSPNNNNSLNNHKSQSPNQNDHNNGIHHNGNHSTGSQLPNLPSPSIGLLSPGHLHNANHNNTNRSHNRSTRSNPFAPTSPNQHNTNNNTSVGASLNTNNNSTNATSSTCSPRTAANRANKVPVTPSRDKMMSHSPNQGVDDKEEEVCLICQLALWPDQYEDYPEQWIEVPNRPQKRLIAQSTKKGGYGKGSSTNSQSGQSVSPPNNNQNGPQQEDGGNIQPQTLTTNASLALLSPSNIVHQLPQQQNQGQNLTTPSLALQQSENPITSYMGSFAPVAQPSPAQQHLQRQLSGPNGPIPSTATSSSLPPTSSTPFATPGKAHSSTHSPSTMTGLSSQEQQQTQNTQLTTTNQNNKTTNPNQLNHSPNQPTYPSPPLHELQEVFEIPEVGPYEVVSVCAANGHSKLHASCCEQWLWHCAQQQVHVKCSICRLSVPLQIDIVNGVGKALPKIQSIRQIIVNNNVNIIFKP